MDSEPGKADPFERRRSMRRSIARQNAAANDSYQPNTGLILSDSDDDNVPLSVSEQQQQQHHHHQPQSPDRPSRTPSQSSHGTAMSKRPSSIIKPADHLTLNSSPSRSGRNAQPRGMGIGVSADRPASSRGPAHHYDLFQNTVPVDEMADATAILPDPAGGYRRRADSVGTDAMGSIVGHTEDLPPYTRYPEEAYTSRESGLHAVSASPIARATVAPLPAGAGGIGLATLNPEFEASTDDLAVSPSRQSTRRLSNESHQKIMETEDISEKPTGRKWQKRATKKVCGVIPYWAVCLLAASLLLGGVIVGAVIGTLLGKPSDSRGGTHPDSPTKPTHAPDPDVNKLPTLPPNLPPLATGRYSLAPLVAQSSLSSCVADSSQNQAWSCSVPFSMYYVGLSEAAGQPNTANQILSLASYNNANNSDMPKYPWGAAPPVLDSPTSLELVRDMFELDDGPAWWARVLYNKTVIIDADKLSASSSPSSRRHIRRSGDQEVSDPGNDPDHRAGQPDLTHGPKVGAGAGDRPWICTWPGTVLEVYIYPEQDSNHSADPPAPAPSSTPAYSVLMPSSAYGGGPTGTTDAPTTGSADWPPFRNMPARPSYYPKVFKIKERRIAALGSTTASCRQVEVGSDGQGDEPVRDSTGKPIVVIIDEDLDSSPAVLRARGGGSGQNLARDDAPTAAELSGCGCLWWVH